MIKVFNVDYLIDGELVVFELGLIFECRFLVIGEVVIIVVVGKVGDVDCVVMVVDVVFEIWLVIGFNMCWLILNVCVDVLEVCFVDIVVFGVVEIGGIVGWIGFNVMLVFCIMCEVVVMMI